MKNLILFLVIIATLIGCNSSKLEPSTPTTEVEKSQDTVRIANDSIEYEITIIEPGFSSWLIGRAKPRGYYSQKFLENRNRIYVTEWNRRVQQPIKYSPQLYQLRIDYNWNINYGYEVNYLLYYYFIYFQMNYKQQLTGFVPRL
jgi:hypothetical protein